MRRSFLLIIILITSATQTNLASPNLLAGTLYPLAFVSALTLLITILIVEGKRNFAKRAGENNNSNGDLEIWKSRKKEIETS